MKDKGSNSRSAKKPAKAKKSKKVPVQRQRPAKDGFGEQLLRRKGSIDPKIDLEF
jgi:hypothetical protein